MPPAFAALFGSVGFVMYSEQGVPTVAEHSGAVPPDKVVNVIVVNPSKKTVRFPWFDIFRWNRGPPKLLNWARVARYGRNVVAELYGLLRFVTQNPLGMTWTKPRYCHRAGFVDPLPAPVLDCCTVRTNREVALLFFKSVAFNRMIDPSQFRFGKGAFTQTLLPKEKIPSPATRSGPIPSSCIFWACSQALPVPNQIERFA